MFSKITKAYQLGFTATISVLVYRVQHYRQIRKLRWLTKKNVAHHDWKRIQKIHAIDIDFHAFFENLHTRDLVFVHDIFKKGIIFGAFDYDKHQFKIFDQTISYSEKISWHKDYMTNALFKSDFYKNISIKTYYGKNLGPDIKYPWELSRFLYAPVLGYVFEKTKNPNYAQTFLYHIQDWLEDNPYLIGVNWLCPMDVAIRALNWLCAFQFFKKESFPLLFWQRLICSLYDHMIYLEHNWEIYDTRTSNHYLSNLIGYYYLTYFFKVFTEIDKQHDWCFQEILKEFDKQIFFEGTDYEGSTRYHKLVTELFSLFYLLAKQEGRKIPESFEQKYQRMIDFINWATPVNGNLVQIGDNDSGCILAPLYGYITQPKEKELTGTQHFEQFGISFIKTDRVHLTLRHHSYESKQPTGHFHNDIGSITFALDGKDILVDPGSFVYTPSSVWRNKFRSAAMHNTSYIINQEPVLFTHNIFFLEMPIHNLRINRKDPWLLQTSHNLYQQLHLTFHRSVKFDQAEHHITIIDWWERTNFALHDEFEFSWHFMFAPHIQIMKNDNSWCLYDREKFIGFFKSTITFEKKESWFSAHYHHKEPTISLNAKHNQINDAVVTIIEYE